MTAIDQADDVQAIKRLISAHFDSLRWTPNTRPDWNTFSADFLPDVSLFPAARPVRRQTLDAFMTRMDAVAKGALRSFEETTLGMQILLFGNVGVVLSASRMLENDTETNHDVHGYLVLKDAGNWRIAAHAWDHATDQLPIPGQLRRS